MESPCPYPLPLSRGSGAIVESSLLHPLLLIKDVRERLNTHIRKKRLQLLWGLPYIILNSLETSTPSVPGFLECTTLLDSKEHQRPLFRAERRKHLERHLRKKMVHHKWGLPKRIQKSLKLFIPPEAAKQEPILDEKVPVSTSIHTGLCEITCGSSEACTNKIYLTAHRSEGSGQTTLILDNTSEATIAEHKRSLLGCQTRTCPQSKTGKKALLLKLSVHSNTDATELSVTEEKEKHVEFQRSEENCDFSEDTKGSWETFLLGTSPPGTLPAFLNGTQSALGISFMDTLFINDKGQCHQNLQLGTELEMKCSIAYKIQESSPLMRFSPAQLTDWEREPNSGAKKSLVNNISGSQKLPYRCQRGFSQGFLKALNPPEELQPQLLSHISGDEVPKSNFVQEGQNFFGISGSCRSATMKRTGNDLAGSSGAQLLPGQLASLEDKEQEAKLKMSLPQLPLEFQLQPSPSGAPLAETLWALNRDMLVNQKVQIKLDLQSPSPVPVISIIKPIDSLQIPEAESKGSLVTDDIKRYFEIHLREKLLHQKWGFPKRLQESITLFLLQETIN